MSLWKVRDASKCITMNPLRAMPEHRTAVSAAQRPTPFDSLVIDSQDQAVTAKRTSAPITQQLVGRERELSSLRAALGTPNDDGRRVLLIAGEPSVGKTRLLREFLREAESSGWSVLYGSAYDSEGMPPYLPFIEALQNQASAPPEGQSVAEPGPRTGDVRRLLSQCRSRLPHGANALPRPGSRPLRALRDSCTPA